MLQLSEDPELQKLQLEDLVRRSHEILAKLTSPVVCPEDKQEPLFSFYDSRSVFDYEPPTTRFARYIQHGKNISEEMD